MEEEEEYQRRIKEGICPVCQKKLRHLEGCLECPACGWSLCIEA